MNTCELLFYYMSNFALHQLSFNHHQHHQLCPLLPGLPLGLGRGGFIQTSKFKFMMHIFIIPVFSTSSLAQSPSPLSKSSER